MPGEPGGVIGNETHDDITDDTTWESSDTSIAEIREGKVVGIAPGTVTIRGTYNNSSFMAGEVTVTVEEATEENPQQETEQTSGEQLTDIPNTAVKKIYTY